MKYSNKIRSLFCKLIVIVFVPFIYNTNGVARNQPKSISKIEAYLQTLQQVALPFEQKDKSGVISKGILLIKKPYLFRANYEAPHPLAIVGTKNYVSVYDYELEELSRIDAKDNIFKFLLEDKISISSNLNILEYQEENNIIRLLVSHKDTDQRARIEFFTKPIKLLSLEIPEDGNDFRRNTIQISFQDPRQMQKHLPELFSFKNPAVYGRPKHYSTKDILKIARVR